eukprot:GFUD01018988.1.p1 GENE.GFUD01018988.1~~GFUD01018988.1.p1  ORF type:complete len:253 (-),score=56.36 GFUD01018988.1:108-866(-)
MPGMTDEWKLPSHDNKLKYFIRIFGFRQKMRTWRAGREVHSMPFHIGESEFSFDIYPNGDEKNNRGHVSVFLRNRNSWAVKVNVEFKIGSRICEDTFEIPINSNCGWGKFHDHDDLLDDDDALNSEGNLNTSADISLIWEEVTGNGKKEDVDGLKSEVTDLKRKIETLETNIMSKLEALENDARRKTRIACPECPVCFEEMKPPTKIVQCVSGHFICLQCRDRPEVTCCPLCKEKFTGRATGMEKYLRTIAS